MLRLGTRVPRVSLRLQHGFARLAHAQADSEKKDLPPPVAPTKMSTRILKALRMHPDDIVSPPSVSPYFRYLMLPAAIANHVCLGSVYAWSIFNQPLTRLGGVVAPAGDDWMLGDVSLTFSLVMGGFIWGAVLGKYLEEYGPRASCTIGGLCLGSGFGLGALAIHLHSLPLLYAGGLVWGLANGWAYVPPVATLLKWFPDRKGFASGAAILGYGGGAMVAAPIFTNLLQRFEKAPEFLGPQGAVELVGERGRMYANVLGEMKEVVVATAADLAHHPTLSEGVYLVGSGSTGAAETFTVLGAGYCVASILAAMTYRFPPANYQPATPSDTTMTSKTAITVHNVGVEQASRAPQFWLGWSCFALEAAGAFGIISCSKTMLTESIGTAMPNLVTAGFAASFVASVSASNLLGRLFWSNFSDLAARWKGGDPFFGRRLTYSLMFGITPPMYAGIIWSIHQAGESSILPLVVFSGSVFGIVAGFGGTAATMPAMMGDLFGTKNVGIITARQLSCILPASFLGPKLVTYFREKSTAEACADLAARVPDDVFLAKFGQSKEHFDMLLSQKTITINRLLPLTPPGTPDPTPFLYDKSMIVLAVLPALALLSARLMKPVDAALHTPPVDVAALAPHEKGAVMREVAEADQQSYGAGETKGKKEGHFSKDTVHK